MLVLNTIFYYKFDKIRFQYNFNLAFLYTVISEGGGSSPHGLRNSCPRS